MRTDSELIQNQNQMHPRYIVGPEWKSESVVLGS